MSNFWGLFLFEKEYLKNRMNFGFLSLIFGYEKILVADRYYCPSFDCWLVRVWLGYFNGLVAIQAKKQ